MVLAPKLDITKEFVMSKVDSYTIYRFEIPNVQIGVAICSPLRIDRVPSFVVRVHESGQLKHTDYGREEFHGDCIDFICQKYQLNYDQALRKICRDFGILDNSNKYKEIEKQYVKPIMDIRRSCMIQVEARRWHKKDLEYWGRYGITLEELRGEEVYPIARCWINRMNHPLQNTEIAFAYRFPNGFKLYFPERSRELRWKSNIPLSTIEHENRIESTNRVIVTKSRKDCILLSKYLPGVISVQNESRAAFNGEFISKLQGKDVIINFDADPVGKTNSMKLTKEYGFRHINVPDIYLPKAKDYSDLFFHFGEKAVLDHLKLKNLL